MYNKQLEITDTLDVSTMKFFIWSTTILPTKEPGWRIANEGFEYDISAHITPNDTGYVWKIKILDDNIELQDEAESLTGVFCAVAYQLADLLNAEHLKTIPHYIEELRALPDGTKSTNFFVNVGFLKFELEDEYYAHHVGHIYLDYFYKRKERQVVIFDTDAGLVGSSNSDTRYPLEHMYGYLREKHTQ